MVKQLSQTVHSIASAISESFHNQRFLTIRTYDQDGKHELTGIVVNIDQQLRRIKVSHDYGVDWILCEDIIDVMVIIE